MTFNIGDKVKIKDVGFKNSYKNIIDHVGFIADIMSYHSVVVNADIIKYYVDVPNYHNEYQANGYYVFDNTTDCLELVKEPAWYGYATIDPVEPKITIKKENKTMEILELYHDIKKGEIDDKYKKDFERLRNSIPEIKRVKEFFETMRDVKGLRLAFEYEWDKHPQYMEQLNKLNEKYDKKQADLRLERNEISTMLSECETYEQKQNILRAYGVIDEQGKLRK
jgi:hypothetical protein